MKMDEVTQDQINIARWALVASIILLFLAIPSGLWPYSYYVLLRWVVAGTGAFSAYITYGLKKTAWVAILGLVALLFNPIVPIHLAKSDWVVIDFIVAILYFVVILVIRLPKTDEVNSQTS